MQVHWLRVILDEGHMLGASLQMTNKLSMAINLRAERRWIMTGLPRAESGHEHTQTPCFELYIHRQGFPLHFI